MSEPRLTNTCDVCECPDGDHYDWCTPQARAASRPSKKLISDERLRRLRADWAQADETGSYPGVIESSEVLLVCDELIASRAAHEPPAVPVEIARLNRRVADLERVEKLQQQVINDLCQRAAQPPGAGMYCRRCDAHHRRIYCPDCGLKLIAIDPTSTKEV